MEFIELKGNENDIITLLQEYTNEGGAKLLLHNMQSNAELLKGEESYERFENKQEGEGLDFFSPQYDYYINIKKTTLAFLGLVIDIRFTKGFLGFVLSVFGVHAEAIRKLSKKEKCVLLLVKYDSIKYESGKYFVQDHSKCLNFCLDCTFRDYDRCRIEENSLNNTIKQLLENGIIEKTSNDSLKLIF